MKRYIGIIAVVLMSLGLSACYTTSDQGPSDVSGPMLGGVAGADSHSVSTTSSHTTRGSSVLGGAVGKSMDNVDQLKLNQSLESNRTNQTTSWSNPDSNNSYTVTPTRTFTGAGGEPCRDFTTSSTVDGKRQTVYGTACRGSNGKWRIISS